MSASTKSIDSQAEAAAELLEQVQELSSYVPAKSRAEFVTRLFAELQKLAATQGGRQLVSAIASILMSMLERGCDRAGFPGSERSLLCVLRMVVATAAQNRAGWEAGEAVCTLILSEADRALDREDGIAAGSVPDCSPEFQQVIFDDMKTKILRQALKYGRSWVGRNGGISAVAGAALRIGPRVSVAGLAIPVLPAVAVAGIVVVGGYAVYRYSSKQKTSRLAGCAA